MVPRPLRRVSRMRQFLPCFSQVWRTTTRPRCGPKVSSTRRTRLVRSGVGEVSSRILASTAVSPWEKSEDQKADFFGGGVGGFAVGSLGKSLTARER